MLSKKKNIQKPKSPPTGHAACRDVPENEEERRSRRGFFKKAAVGVVALSGTAETARVVVSSVPDNSPQKLHDKDVQAGDQMMTQRELVMMSDREKEEMVQTIIDSHNEQL